MGNRPAHLLWCCPISRKGREAVVVGSWDSHAAVRW